MHAWWHAGEENAVAIYAGGWKKGLAGRCAALVFLVVLYVIRPDVIDPVVGGIIFVFFILLTILMLIGDRRRAIIFTVRTVVYRPMFTAPREVAFGKILGLRRVNYYKTQPGIALDLPDWQSEIWPLFFGNTTEILDRLKAATGKPLVDG